MSDACTACGAASSTLYVVEGYIGTYYECPRCHGVDEPADPGPELITDTFTPSPTVAPDFGTADELRLLAIADKLTGARA